MPVQIVLTSSDPKNGKINKGKMDTAIQNYEANVSLTTLSGSFTVIKKQACWYTKDEVLYLLGINPESLTDDNMLNKDITGLKIYFGVQPVSSVAACDGTDYSNMANTMMFATDENNDVLRDENDLMLIPGYRSVIPPFTDACCGSMSGGNGNG
ncbi:MAG: hypothetical protein ABJC98_00555 [Bacteroidota bacterium]